MVQVVVADRRRVHVRLTEAGYDAFERHAACEEHGENALLSVLSEGEKRTLADLLRKPVEAAEAAPDGSEPKRSRSDGS
ncbi:MULTISPECIES: hypothetical protein [unclassified Streptomyces]|uniref:hypothetical protein n=1 Tax=unclassified Streptomyces TaxID=2593676 RepID=UPI00365CE2D2